MPIRPACCGLCCHNNGLIAQVIGGAVIVLFPFQGHILARQDTRDFDQLHETNTQLPQYNNPGTNLRKALTSSGKRVLEIHEYEDRGGASNRRPETDMFNDDVCSSAVIVVGTPTKSSGFLSKSETTVFTDYSIRVHSVLRNSGQDSIAADTIMLTHPFGEVHPDEGTIRATNPDYPALQVGAEYILFLLAIPGAARDYKSTDDLNTYLIVNDHVRPLARHADAEFRAEWLSTFTASKVESTIASIAQSCR